MLPGVDAVVHVEPGAGSLVERVRAAAQGVDRVREVHNVQLIDVDGRTEASLHLKLPARHLDRRCGRGRAAGPGGRPRRSARDQ